MAERGARTPVDWGLTMHRSRLLSLCLALLVVLSWSTSGAGTFAQLQEQQPPSPPPSRTAPPGQQPPATQTPPPAGRSGGQAKPRPAEPQGQPPKAKPRPPAPPPRELPPRYFAPRRYYFPPVSLHRSYYYHPYFGFYFGPYYGPYYPYPGPFFGPLEYSRTTLRLKVKPVETQVYVDGYYAGEVDDFDGIFQRLYLPAGEHQIELYLPGYRTFHQSLYLNPGEAREIVHQMVRLRPGEQSAPPAVPLATQGAPQAPTVAIPSESPASPFGILTLGVDPGDAQVLLDGEVWLMTEGRNELVIHVPAGKHTLEVRKDGYQSFRTEIELAEGSRTRLNVQLIR